MAVRRKEGLEGGREEEEESGRKRTEKEKEIQ